MMMQLQAAARPAFSPVNPGPKANRSETMDQAVFPQQSLPGVSFSGSPEKTRRLTQTGLFTSGLMALGSVLGLGSVFIAPSLPFGVDYTADGIAPVLVQANNSKKTVIPEVNRDIDLTLGNELHDLYLGMGELGDDAEEAALRHLNDSRFYSLNETGQAANKELVTQYRALHINAVGQQPEAEKALLKAYCRKVIDAKASPQILQRYDELIDSFYTIRHSQQGQTGWMFFYLAALVGGLTGAVGFWDKWINLPPSQKSKAN